MKKLITLFACTLVCATYLFSQSAGYIGPENLYVYSGSSGTVYFTTAPSPTPSGPNGNLYQALQWEKLSSTGVSSVISMFPPSITSVTAVFTESCKVACKVVWSSSSYSYTNYINVIVENALTPGTISIGSSTVCSGTAPSQMYFTKTPSGGDGSYTYQWYYSTNNSSWIPIGGATLNYCTPTSPITGTTYYRCLVDGGAGGLPTNTITVSTYPSVSAGAITGVGTICYGADAGTLSFSTAPSGGTGSGYTYQWQSYNGSWSNVSGTNTTYAPGNLNSTTQYRCVVTNACASAYTDAYTISVLSDLGAGQITANGSMSICENGDAPALLFSTTPSGETGSFSYQWQSSSDNITWSDVSGTSDTYSPGALSATTYYRCNVNGTCNVVKPTNAITVNVIGTYAISTPQTDVSSKYCKDSSVTITITNPNSKNNWYNENQEFIQNATTYTINNLSDSIILYVEAIDANECKSQKTKVEINKDPIKADFYVDNTKIEVGDSVSFSFIGTGASEFYWVFNNGFTSTLLNPKVFYNTAGIYDVTLTVTSDIGCTDAITVKNAAVVLSEGSGIQELNNETLLIYPMPVSDILTIEYSGTSSAIATIYSMNGQILKEQKLVSDKNTMDMSSFANGTYILKVISNNGKVYSNQLVKGE